MKQKDWMRAAAEEIALISDGPDAKQLAEIVAKHFEASIDAILVREPDGTIHRMNVFKDGIAYMPVPRCDSCAHWARPDPKQDGICTLWKGNRIVVTTSADYGCVRWEAK